MLKHLHLKLTLLMAVLLAGAGSVWGEDTETFNLSYSHGTKVTTVPGTDATLIFDKGTNNQTSPAYYSKNPVGVRVYGKNTLTVSSTTRKITSVEFTFAEGSPQSFKISSSEGSDLTSGSSPLTYTVATGTNSVLFTNTGSSGNYAFTKVVVTFAASTKTFTPVISGAESFFGTTEVSITCGTDGAAIQYSTDGGTTWNSYSAPFTISATATVQAKATKDGLDDSGVSSKTFTKITPMTVADAIDYIDAGENLTGQYVTGKISQIDSYSSNAITYWISDDGTTTTQMEVYKGKGLNGANFTAKTDLEVGDVVVVYGDLKLYNSSIYEFDEGSQLISRTEKPASDLTKTADITLDYKNGETVADLTEYFTTSSTGTLTYTVADETVIESAVELISALKVGATSVTVSQEGDLNYKAGEITISVTVQDTREAATTIPAINISTLKVGNEGSVTVSAPVKADEGVTFSYSSSDDDILIIVGGNYEALAVGTVTVTVTATPSNTNLYTSVTETFEVTVEADVKTDTDIDLDKTSGSTPYGTTKSVDYNITDNYDGTLSYAIDQDIADVEIGADAITFTPKAVGTAVITISAPATPSFNAADDVTYTLTVTPPEGGTVAAESGTTLLFGESFGDNSSSARDWDDSYSVKSGVSSVYSGITGYTVTNVKQGKNNTGSKLSGLNQSSQDTDASIIIGPLNVANYSNLTLTYQWKAASIKGTYSTSAYYATSSTGAYTEISGTGAGATTFVERSYTLPAAAQVSTLYLKIVWNTSNTQAIIDEVQLSVPNSITTKLNANGYATFCSEYPLDFTNADGYTAWQVKGVSSTSITFEKITGSVKGGTGIFLMGTAGADITLTSANSTNTLSSNMLVGTLAPTVIKTEDGSSTNFGLSGKNFVKINAGTVPAHKAYLPVATSALPSASRLTLTFNDETAGISTTLENNEIKNREVYDLTGRRVNSSLFTPHSSLKKGLYIVNGKKTVVK